MKSVVDVALTVVLVLAITFGVLRFMRPMMLTSWGPDTQQNRDRFRWVEKTTMRVVAVLALIGALVGVLLSAH